jgi:hypothetical protein
MDNSRMSNADMLQYCDEALAWEEFGPVDIFFFESVKKILLGQCSAFEEPEEYTDDLMGIERPVSDAELEPEYCNYADIYYGEEGDDEIPDYSQSNEDIAFSAEMFGNGFFAETVQAEDEAAPAETEVKKAGESPKKKAAEKKTAKKTNSKKTASDKKTTRKSTKSTTKRSAKKAESDKSEEPADGGRVAVKL